MKYCNKVTVHVCLVFIILQLKLVYSNEEKNELTEAEKDAVETQYSIMDNILSDLQEKYEDMKPNDFWHPYVFGTGGQNREVIHLTSTQQKHLPGKFKQWKMVNIGLEQYLIGLASNSIKIFNSAFKEISSTDMQFELDSMEVFTKWDNDLFKPTMIVVAATKMPSIELIKFDQTLSSLTQITSLSVTSPVKSIMICNVIDENEKVVAVPQNTSFPITIYNVDVTKEGAHLWFFQHITDSKYKSVLVHQPDTSSAMIILATSSTLNIYEFSKDRKQFAVEQTLTLLNNAGEETCCTNLFQFTHMYQHYLGCLEDQSGMSNSQEKEVYFINYNFYMQEYEEKRSFKAIKAIEIYPVKIDGTRDDLIFLAKQNEENDVVINILAYDGEGEFQIVQKCSLDACKGLTGFSQGVHFSFEETDAFLFPTAREDEGSPVITFFTEVLTRSSPVFDQSMELYRNIKTLNDEMMIWRNIMTKTDETLANRVNPEGDNIVTGNWTVKSILTDDVTVHDVKGRDVNSDGMFQSLKFGDVDFTEEDFGSTNQQIVAKMNEMDATLDFVMSKLDDAVLKDMIGQQSVSTSVQMNGNLIAQHVNANNLEVNTIGGKDVQSFFNSLASKKDSVIRVSGGLVFTQPMEVSEMNFKRINTVSVDDFAVLSADNKFTCQSAFKSIEALEDIQVTIVNGKNLAESVVMADDINGFHFTDGLVAYSGAETETNYPFDNVLLRSVPQDVTSTFVFDSAQFLAPVEVDKLNNKSFKEFTDNLILRNHQGKITGKKSFKSSANVGSLLVEETWNGFQFPADFFSVKDSVISLDGMKSFDKVIVSNVTLNGKVDGVTVSDLVSLSEPQEITSAWTFTTDKAVIRDDIFVTNKVDGVLMEGLLHQGILNVKDNQFEPNADILFQGPVSVKSLSVGSTLNDQLYNELFDHLIKFDDQTECVVPGTTTILGDVTFTNLNLKDNKINGFSTKNFLTKDTTQTITNPVTFDGNPFFAEMYALNTIDGVMVEDILQAFRISSSASTDIPWALHFDEIECLKGFDIEGPVNGMTSYGLNVARTKGMPSQTFMGPIIMENPIFSNLTTEQLKLDPGRKIQNLDIDMWNTMRAKLSEPAVFTEPFHVGNGILVQESLQSEKLNGVLVQDYQDKVLRSDKDSIEFTGDITINNLVKVEKGKVNFKEAVIDNFKLDDFVEHGFPLNIDNQKDAISISEHWIFESLEFDKELEVPGLVCGVDLEKLNTDSVKRSDQEVEVSGNKIFNNPLLISSSLISPQINEKTMENLFFLNQEQEIQGNAKFVGDVFKNELNTGSINEIRMDWLSQVYSFQNGNHVLNHDVHVTDQMKSKSMHINGKAQGRDFNEVLTNSWTHADPNIVFTDEVTFTDKITLNKDVNTVEYNGINMEKLYDDVVQLDQDLDMVQPVTFANRVVSNNMILSNGNFATKQLENGVNWNDLIEKSVKIDDDNAEILLDNVQFENIITSSPITFNRLNGVDFDKYILLDSEQDLGTLNIITAYLNTSNVDLKGRLGAFDISDEFHDTLLNNAEGLQKLAGNNIVTGPVHIKENLQCFGEDLKSQIVSTKENIILQGPIEFKAPIVVKKNVMIEKPLNNHTVESIFQNVFSTGGDLQEISQLWTFKGPVVFKEDVSGRGLEKSDIKGLIEQKEEELKEAEKRMAEEKDSFLKKCNSLLTIQGEMSKNPLKLDSFDTHQVIGLQNEARHVLAIGKGPNPFLLVQSTNCETTIYAWQSATQTFDAGSSSTTILGNVDSWQSVAIDEDQSLIVLSQSVSACSQDSGLYFFTSSSGHISSIQMISSENVASFKLAKGSGESGKIMLVTLFESNAHDVGILEWVGNNFHGMGSLQFNNTMVIERVDISLTREGFGIMCQSNEGIQMFEYLTDKGRIVDLGMRSMHPSRTGPMTMFENFDFKYAVVLASETTPALIHPTCNFEVIRFAEKSVEPIQRLQVPEVVSATQFTFSKQEYLAFLSKSHGLFVYKFMGLNGFQMVNSKPYKIFGGFMLDSFYINQSDFEFPHPFMLVLSSNRIEIYKGNVIGDRLTTNFNNLCDI